MNKKTRKGMSLPELVVCLVIAGIVGTSLGVAGVKNAKKANRETVVNELNILATNLSDAYYDLGNPKWEMGQDLDGNSVQDEDDFRDFLAIISQEYAGVVFEFDTSGSNSIKLTPITNGSGDFTGFEVTIAEPQDAYEQNYKAWFITNSDVRYAVVASGGDDTVVEGLDKYRSNEYGDDIVMMIKPKGLK